MTTIIWISSLKEAISRTFIDLGITKDDVFNAYAQSEYVIVDEPNSVL